MSLPGFNATASLYRADESYRMVAAFGYKSDNLHPAQTDPDPEGSYSCMHPTCDPCVPRQCFQVPRIGQICIGGFQVCHCISHNGVDRTFTRPC